MEKPAKQIVLMKKRLLTGWTISRMAYLVIGITVILQAVVNDQWLGILLGGFVTFMGLFAFGCAAGNCSDGSCEVEHDQDQKN